MLKSSYYDRGDVKTRKEIITESIKKAKYNELVNTDKWKPSKPTEGPNLVPLTTTINTWWEKQPALQACDPCTNHRATSLLMLVSSPTSASKIREIY
jgi:hypothetical protein